MSTSGHNEGFRVLEEFTCQAIPGSGLTTPSSGGRGENTGLGTLTDVVVEAEQPPPSQERIAALRAMSSVELLDLLRRSGNALSNQELLAIHDIAAERWEKDDASFSQKAIELSREAMRAAINRAG
jgi:hypothetical protein